MKPVFTCGRKLLSQFFYDCMDDYLKPSGYVGGIKNLENLSQHEVSFELSYPSAKFTSHY
jgi:hypothetical protein